MSTDYAALAADGRRVLLTAAERLAAAEQRCAELAKRVDERNKALITMAASVADFRKWLYDYEDVEDGPDGPRPNWAMRASQTLVEILQNAGCSRCSTCAGEPR